MHITYLLCCCCIAGNGREHSDKLKNIENIEAEQKPLNTYFVESDLDATHSHIQVNTHTVALPEQD